MSSKEPSLTSRKKRRPKEPEKTEDIVAPSEMEGGQRKPSISASQRSVEGTAGPPPEEDRSSGGISGKVGEIVDKVKGEVEETVERGADRARKVSKGVGDKGEAAPSKGDVRGTTPEEEHEIPPPPPDEDVWAEDYEEHIDVEERPSPKPRKKRHYGMVVALVIVLLILLVWTMLSPDVLPETGDSRQGWESNRYLGDYVGYRDIWAGNMTWGLAIRGPSSASVGESLDLSVLVTKIYEKPGNWFFEGTGISLKNVSVFAYDDQGETFLGAMTGRSDTDLGPVATVTVQFDQRGIYELYVYVKFVVYMDMRIGFLPLEAVEINHAYLDVPIVVN